MDLTTEIASGFRVGRYRELRPGLETASANGSAWLEVLSAFERRVNERFLRPITLLAGGAHGGELTRPGFAILALDCLLIDTLQSFREGRVSTGEIRTAKSFKAFLESPRFESFGSRDRKEFFHYVRNGLLHNGQTRGDWKVRRRGPAMLSTDPITGARILNRNLFHEAIVEEFGDYCRELAGGPSVPRELFLRRMDAICDVPVKAQAEARLYFAYGSNLMADEMLRTVPNAVPEGVAFLPGYRLVFDKHSTSRGGDAASIEKSLAQVLWGFLYKVPVEDEGALEKREHGYVERCVRVWHVDAIDDCDSGQQVDAFTFVAKDRCEDACGPTEDYLELVIAGARSRGLPDDYIRWVLADARRAAVTRTP